MNRIVYPAPVRLRLLAAAINFLPWVGLFILSEYSSPDTPNPLIALAVLALLGLQSVLYFAKGQTIGKWMLGLSIYGMDFREKPSFWRLLLRLAAGMTLFVFTPFHITMLFAEGHKSIHDRLSGTCVGTAKRPRIMDESAKSRLAFAVDLTFPVWIALGLCILYGAMFLLYLGASLITIGYLFLYIDQFVAILDAVVWTAGIGLTAAGYAYQIYLWKKSGTTLGKLIVGKRWG
ncbi:RDD family protein [Paenibacillus sp. S-38]|uniref:RDD family protein n=1 Tax=Paenibacillus sp. S-38 TaxID=3416710 RepID=UPI003CF4E868